MRGLRALWTRLRHGRQAQADFEAELQSHIDLHTEEGLRAGLTPSEALRAALLQLGGAEQARQAYRERASLPWLDGASCAEAS